MNQSPEQLALQHHMSLCQGHAEALQDALQDMQTRALNVDAHDYPDNPTERFERLQAAVNAAGQLMSVLTRFQSMHRALAQK